MKSFKIYTQTFGGIGGSSVELVECESLADYETFQARIKKDKEYMKIYQEFMLLVDPATMTDSVLTSLE
jgi:hypothetical protein